MCIYKNCFLYLDNQYPDHMSTKSVFTRGAALLVMAHLQKERTITVFSGVGSIELCAVGRMYGP